MVEAVLFDLDNTLIDFYRFKRESCLAAVRAMRKVGLGLSEKQAMTQVYAILKKHSLEDKLVFDRLLKEAEGTVDPRKLAHGIWAYREARKHQLTPYKGVIPTLKKLQKKGIKLGIVSDAPRMKAWMRLVAMGIDQYFDVVVTHDDTGLFKPSSKPFAVALKRLKCKPEDVLMVGDRYERDILGAQRLGIVTAYAQYGTEEIAHGDYILKKFEDVLKIV